MRAPSRAIDLEQLAADPHGLLAELRASAPVCWVPELDGWLVTRWDLAVAVMREPVTYTVEHPGFTTGRVLGPSMLSTDGELHRHHREPFVAALRSAPLASAFAQFCEQTATDLVATLSPRREAELREDLAAPLAVAAIRHLLGLETIGVAALLGIYRELAAAVSALSIAGADHRIDREPMNRLGRAVAAAVDASPVLREAAESQSADELVSNAAVMLFGGIETSEGMTSTALWYLLTTPGLMQQVAREPALVPALVDESLRLEPAAARVDRYATTDVTLAGARIRSGDLVIVSVAAANRDPAVFPDPNELRLDRPEVRRHLAFARGPHVCPGRPYAVAETEAAVMAIATGLAGLRLDPDRVLGHQGLVFRKPVALTVRW